MENYIMRINTSNKQSSDSPESVSEPINPNYFYSIRSLAEIFELSQSYWRKRIRFGDIKASRVGRAVRISGKEVLGHMQEYKIDNSTEIERIISQG